jgi:hypothetical protein
MNQIIPGMTVPVLAVSLPPCNGGCGAGDETPLIQVRISLRLSWTWPRISSRSQKVPSLTAKISRLIKYQDRSGRFMELHPCLPGNMVGIIALRVLKDLCQATGASHSVSGKVIGPYLGKDMTRKSKIAHRSALRLPFYNKCSFSSGRRMIVAGPR